MSEPGAVPEAEAVVGPAREQARVLTLRYLVASSAIFFAAGVLGVLLRTSQSDLGRLDSNFFYAVMTAHGLGAFVGWAAFAVMGLSWWMLALVGFPLRRLGAALADAAFWLMLLGVAGVLVTTLLMNFAASWVFLYPLPFHSAGQWSDAATGIFAGSILLVGLSIIAWCVGIVHTIISPALRAVRPTLGTRLGLALGLGYLAPRRFATNPRPAPYPVLPLTVIGLNMVVATLPLAVLLVVMIVQSAAPSVTVDPLLAKNVLWFFGHPVVYLLLFPAVAVYYVLIPRYAKRPLVAGNVVAVAWVLAVFVNLMIWAHHIYLDYPAGSAQAAIDTAMQPLTFAITIPSALSIYSLFFTIYRSDFEWTAASTALFLGIVSWLLAGLSGVVNATIAFDAVVHNTLWIVGHLHHMALLNIGFVIFGAVYALLPELTGKQLYSETLAKWHIWLTFVGGTGNQVLWLVQGLEGAPRRFAVLPERYQDLGSAAVPFVGLIAVAQLLFAWNIVQTLRGRVAKEAAPRPRVASRHVLIAPVAVGLAALAAVGGWILARETAPSGLTTAAMTVQTPAPPGGVTAGDPVRGRQVYAQAGCGACHTLAAAASIGTVGPNLDQSRPSLELILSRVRNGRGAMPAFKGRLSDQQIADVAAFVARSARP